MVNHMLARSVVPLSFPLRGAACSLRAKTLTRGLKSGSWIEGELGYDP